MKLIVLPSLFALLAVPGAAQPSIAGAAPAARTYDGRAGSLDVEPPRIDQAIEVDGDLNEAVWSQAAVLAGFSRYAPVDGEPADHATDVLVWYSPTAIHFGIRASAPAGTVRATLADRDRIQSDDHVIVFLSTYNDSRQAQVFGVNQFSFDPRQELITYVNHEGHGAHGDVFSKYQSRLAALAS